MGTEVSVIMPVYNSEKYLADTLMSITKQSLKDIEIICVDDGSTDSSPQIIERFMEEDNRIRLIRQNNQYAGVARNAGMAVAKGEYLLFLDSDDLFDKEMVEKAYLAAKEKAADVLIFGGREFDEKLEFSHSMFGYTRTDIAGNRVINAETASDELFSITNPAPWNKLFRRAFIKEKGLCFEACKRGNDIFFVYMALALADRIIVIGDELIFYRRNAKESLQNSKSEDPGYFIVPFTNIRRELFERNRFQVVDASFCDVFLKNCFFNLDSLESEAAFKALYDDLKKKLFVDLDIDEIYRRKQFSEKLYKKYRFIMENDSAAYGLHGLGYEALGGGEYPFPFERTEKGSTVVIYGAGKVGQAYYVQASKANHFRTLFWVDKNPRTVQKTNVLSPESVDYSGIDYVVIAVTSSGLKDEISEILTSKLHVAQSKIIWEDPYK